MGPSSLFGALTLRLGAVPVARPHGSSRSRSPNRRRRNQISTSAIGVRTSSNLTVHTPAGPSIESPFENALSANGTGSRFGHLARMPRVRARNGPYPALPKEWVGHPAMHGLWSRAGRNDKFRSNHLLHRRLFFGGSCRRILGLPWCRSRAPTRVREHCRFHSQLSRGR